jgi:hypothetical protein
MEGTSGLGGDCLSREPCVVPPHPGRTLETSQDQRQLRTLHFPSHANMRSIENDVHPTQSALDAAMLHDGQPTVESGETRRCEAPGTIQWTGLFRRGL